MVQPQVNIPPPPYSYLEEVVAVEAPLRKNNRVHFRLDNDEYDRVKRNSKEKGYLKVSDYFRSLALEHDKFMQEKLFLIDNNVKKILELLEKSNPAFSKGLSRKSKVNQLKI